ncbi:coatomer subunit zeta [Lachancea thermotolerans CBS 6340]|uniref:Coatomer subunit zeta n=1 Tax=Lachancea thermotolerans (strain ATCC 56472 / CBS 6340 / NRRL Y-8284) TaxID=559295 RepID=C5DBG9_LACTC|nr:KLTH0A02508p [Lachancea thermotolerans CBS 6340]CAR21126.1 KLTH0A02508p [Lachancea thermotolerans CBS 6340]
MAELSLYSVEAVLLLDNEGNRIYTKYYHSPHEKSDSHITKRAIDGMSSSSKQQTEYESRLFKKTHKQNSEILIFEDCLVLYKEYVDVSLYLVGSIDENELVLQQAFSAIKDSLELILATGIDKKNIIEHFDMVALAIDESIDDGIILETDPATIASRVTKPPSKDAPINIELSEKGLLSAWGFAKSKLAERLQQGL